MKQTIIYVKITFQFRKTVTHIHTGIIISLDTKKQTTGLQYGNPMNHLIECMMKLSDKMLHGPVITQQNYTRK